MCRCVREIETALRNEFAGFEVAFKPAQET